MDSKDRGLPHFFMESESIPDWLEQLKSEREKAKFTKDKTEHG
jgi:hypothetical protein